MSAQTPVKRVLFRHCLNMLGLGVFAALSISLATFFVAAPTAQAATDSTINFQARLMTASGSIVPDGNYNVEFKLYNAASSSGSSQGSCTGDAACLWVETRTSGNTVHVANGYLTVNLGSVTALPTTINWDQDLYLGLNIGGTGTPSWDGEMSPRLHLTAVPYAFRAGQLAQYNGTTGFTSTLSLLQPTGGNQLFQVPDMGAGGTYTLLTTQTANGSYIQNQNSGAQSSANFWISGTGIAGTALQTPTLDATTVGGTLAIGSTNTNTGNINIGTGSTTGAITIGGTTQTGTINIGTGTGIQTLNFGTGATGAKSVTVGSQASSSSLTLDAGTGPISIGTSASARTISIGTGAAVVQTINIGGTGANIIGIGNTQTGGSVSIGNAMTTGTIQIGSTAAQTGTITFGGGTGAQIVNLGTGNGVKTVHIADGTGANVITLGTGQTGGSIALGTAMTTGTITIGGAVAQTGTIILGQSTGTNTVRIGDGTGATTIQIGTGVTNAKTIQIGTGAAMANAITLGGTGANTIAVGNTQTAGSISIGAAMTTGTTTVDAGSGGLNIGTNAVAQAITIGNNTGATSVSVTCGTGTCGFGNNAIDHSTTVGSTTGTSLTTIQGGSGGIALSDASGAINLTGGAASTWSIGSGNALTLTSSNFNVSGGATTLGSSSIAGSLVLQDGAGHTGTFHLVGTLGSNQTYSLPTTGGTICIQTSATCGFESTTGTDFIQNQNASTQTANFNISGTGTSGGFQVASTVDALDTTTSGGTLNIGTVNASAGAGEIVIGSQTGSTVVIAGGGGNQDGITVEGNKTYIGKVSNCIVGNNGTLCMNQSVNSGGGSLSRDMTNNALISGTATNGTGIAAQTLYLQDTTASNTTDVLQGLVVDSAPLGTATGTTNANTTITSIYADAPEANPGDLLELQGYNGTSSSDLFTVGNTGAVLVQPTTNSPPGGYVFQVNNAAGNPYFRIDTGVPQVILGQSSGTNGQLEFLNSGSGRHDLIQSIASTGGLNSTGGLAVTATFNSPTAFQVQNSSNAGILTVDSTDNEVILGVGSAGEATPVTLVLDTGTATTDPTGTAGAIYYNTGGVGGEAAGGVFRCYQDGVWQDCLGMPDVSQRRWGYAAPNLVTATTFDSVGGLQLGAATAAGTSSSAVESNYIDFTTSGTTGNANGIGSGTTAATCIDNGCGATTQIPKVTQGRYMPKLETRIKVDPTAVTSARYWVALTGTDQTGSSGTGSFIGLRYDTSAGDTTWQCVSGNAGTVSTSNTGVTVTAGHYYDIILDYSISGSLTCSVADSGGAYSSALIFTNLPPNGTSLGLQETATQLSATSKQLKIAYAYLGYQ